jgi:hypothetical protein
MIAKYDMNSYVDIDSITRITGYYDSKRPVDWRTKFSINGESIVVAGQEGRNIMDAYLWKWRNTIYDMQPGNHTYRKQLE